MSPPDLRAALTALGYTLDAPIGRPRVYRRCPCCGGLTGEREQKPEGLGPEEAARALGVAQSTLWSWLTGHRKRGVPHWVDVKLRELEEQLRTRRVLAAALAAAPIAPSAAPGSPQAPEGHGNPENPAAAA